MATGLTELSEHEERFGEIAFAYLRAREEGCRPDPREWLARYPDFGPELAGFFADQEAVDRLGAPLREIARAADRPSTETPETSATDDSAAPPASLPRSFGDYQVLEEMGRGGMGVVYKARQLSLNRLVALKVIRAGEWASAEEVRRFRNEAEMVALLDHAHIVPVYEVAEQAGHVYFSMKLVAGGSLAEQLGRFRDDPKAAAALLATVARTVHHAHQRGVLHRDLKPSNILLDENGQPHVTDFGLARRVEADGSSLTQSGAIVGTPSYMAPEQATGQKAATTTATDVYGLGAVFYALLTGRPPFQAENALETLVQVREREPQPPRAANRRVDRDLETICLKCLAKEPQRRYGSALALAEDFDRFLAGKPIQARPAGAWERGIKWARRRPLAVTTALCLLALLMALIGGAGWVLGDRGARQREAEAIVRDALAAAASGLRPGNPWDPALISAAERAQAQLGGLLGSAMRREVEQLQKDVSMLAEMDRIRLDQAAGVQDDQFDRTAAGKHYAQAFRDYGIDVETMDPAEAAALVQASALCRHLVTALDDWATTLGPEDAGQPGAGLTSTRLLAVARQADAEPWRNRLRDLLWSGKTAAVEQLAGTAPVEELPAATLMLLGLRLREAGLAAQAVDLLRRAQRRFPADFWINTILAQTLAESTPPQLEEAIGFYRVAVALRPQSPGAHLNLGRWLQEHDVDAARAEFQEAVRLKPDYATARIGLSMVENRLALAWKQKGQLDKAIDACHRAIQHDPKSANAHNTLGTLYAARNQPDAAVAEYKAALQLDPRNFAATLNLGARLMLQGNLQESEECLAKAVRLQPGSAQAHAYLGSVLSRQGKRVKALEALEKAVELKPDDAEVLMNLGANLARLGNWAKAEAAWQKAVELRTRPRSIP